MEHQITPVKNDDGSFALCNGAGDKFNPATDRTPYVWALIKTEGRSGERYFMMGVSPGMLEQPDTTERQLIERAGIWASRN